MTVSECQWGKTESGKRAQQFFNDNDDADIAYFGSQTTSDVSSDSDFCSVLGRNFISLIEKILYDKPIKSFLLTEDISSSYQDDAIKIRNVFDANGFITRYHIRDGDIISPEGSKIQYYSWKFITSKNTNLLNAIAYRYVKDFLSDIYNHTSETKEQFDRKYTNAINALANMQNPPRIS